MFMLITIIKDKDYLPMDLHPNHFDLISPDGRITSLKDSKATLTIEGISPFFVGFDIDQSRISFNLKSSLAQVGVDSRMTHLIFDKAHGVTTKKITNPIKTSKKSSRSGA